MKQISQRKEMFLLIYYRNLVEMAEIRGGVARSGQPNALREALKRLAAEQKRHAEK